jgi:hypothetical protein
MIEVNPLNILGGRRLNFLPKHFSKSEIKLSEFGNEIENWIETNLKSRYSLLRIPCINKDGHMKSATIVGFEDHKEITYFMLACPYLRRN